MIAAAAAAAAEGGRRKKEEKQVSSSLWTTCAQWVVLLLHLVLAFIENATSLSTSTSINIDLALGRFLALFGLKSLLSTKSNTNSNSDSNSNSTLASFPPLISHDHQHFLPPRTGQDVDKLTVVLDLDETLVCAYESSSLPSFIHSKVMQAGIKWFELQCVSVEKEGEGKQKINHVTVYERPGLQEFLSKASEFAELVLFTAGLEGYARPLVDKIDSENRIAARLYRPATVTTKYRDHVKDLSHLARDLHRTVIIDNNPFSFLLQPMNGIPCVPFTGAHTDDQQLLQVLLPLLEHLATQKDVRPVLYERFHMPAWFEKRGIPTSDWPS